MAVRREQFFATIPFHSADTVDRDWKIANQDYKRTCCGFRITGTIFIRGPISTGCEHDFYRGIRYTRRRDRLNRTLPRVHSRWGCLTLEMIPCLPVKTEVAVCYLKNLYTDEIEKEFRPCVKWRMLNSSRVSFWI